MIYFVFFSLIAVKNENNILSVDFQNGFKGDPVSLYIEDVEIFKDLKLVSSSLADKVRMSVKVQVDHDGLLVFSSGEEIRVPLENKENICFKVATKNKIFTFFVQKSKGSYVAFYCELEGQIMIRQSRSPFVYY